MVPAKLRILAFAVVAVAPPVTLALLGISSIGWMAAGAGLWTLSVILKILLGIPVLGALKRLGGGPKVQAALLGAWSGLCELGAVALVYATLSRPASIGDALGVGVGAGSLEVLVVVGLGWVALIVPSRLLPHDPPGDWFPRWSGIIERVWTSVGHAASRGLVWLAFQGPAFVPAAILALCSFTAVDGVAGYGHDQKWNWTDSRLSRRFSLFLAVAGFVESLALVIFLSLSSKLGP